MKWTLALALVACSSSPHSSKLTPTPPANPGPPATSASSPVATTPPAPPTVVAQQGVYLEDLDKTIDPCTDFYEYGNGSWRKANPIPASMPRWSRRWKAGEDAKGRLVEILTDVSAKQTWKPASVEQLIGDFYASCMDQKARDERGAKPLEPMLQKIAAIKDLAGMQAIMVELRTYGELEPFNLGGNSDLHTPTDVVAWVTAAGLGLPDRDYYVKTEKRFVEARAKYLEHVAAMFELAGVAKADAAKQAKTVFNLELKLAKASLDNVALRDAKNTDHKMTVAELQKLTPKFDWTKFFTAVNVPLDPLNVTEPKFFQEFNKQLTATPIADWRVYLAFHYINSRASSLSTAFTDEQFAFYGKFLNGTAEQKPLSTRCAEATDANLGEALGQKYVEKYFPPAAKARMKKLVDNLLAAMKETIDHLDWMAPETKKKALEKVATFNTKIGYPDKWKDYSAISIKRDAYFENVAAASAWGVEDDRKTIGKPVDRGRWGMTPPTSDAYYNPSLNEIVFPAGILQPPAFRMDAVDAINYGAIGVVIGHEISHGFDDDGAQFDAQGRLENWWTKTDLDAFKKKGQCVVDQFDGYFIEPKIHHNGKLVLGESIGDSGGANLAYRAFQLVQKQTAQPTIDGFTPDQQFFIGWDQFRGDAVRIETQRTMIQGDPHPIGKFRVIGPLSNMPEFAKAFSCKEGTAMVRPAAKQCRVW